MIHFLLQRLYDIVKDNCEMGGSQLLSRFKRHEACPVLLACFDIGATAQETSWLCFVEAQPSPQCCHINWPQASAKTGNVLPMFRWLASRAKKEECLCLIQALVVVSFGSWHVDSVTSLASFGSLNLTGLLSHCRSCPSETKFGHLSGAWIAVGIQIDRGPPWSMPKSYCSSASCLSSHAISAGTWPQNQGDTPEPSLNCQCASLWWQQACSQLSCMCQWFATYQFSQWQHSPELSIL